MAKRGSIQLRVKQELSTNAPDQEVTVFAPSWVKKALAKIQPALEGARFEIEPPSGQFMTIQGKISLIQLLTIARNERLNTSGIIQFHQYEGIDEQTVIALRDLAKHCVIVGKDIATHFGGYPNRDTKQPLNKEVMICDLPGLQFQELNNTGRHVLLLKQGMFPKGALDKEIYQNIVNAEKPSYQQAKSDKSGRFIEGKFKNQSVLFDVKAYLSFVAQDFMLAATAINEIANRNQSQSGVNFKFLKYGTGFFADSLSGAAKEKLSENLALAVKKGVEALFALPLEKRNNIKRIELPFFKDGNPKIDSILDNIEKLCENHQVEFASTNEDALAPTSRLYMTATTNCSDPHAVTGNEMNYLSVDAAIAENLRKKANNFSPNCNKRMQEKYVTLSLPNLRFQGAQNLATRSTTIGYLLSAFAFGACIKSVFAPGIGLLASWPAVAIGMVMGLVAFNIVLTIRESFKVQQYQQYKQKTPAEIEQLYSTQKSAFLLGYKAAKSPITQLYSLFQLQTYVAPKAYYAGYECKQQNDKDLKCKLS